MTSSLVGSEMCIRDRSKTYRSKKGLDWPEGSIASLFGWIISRAPLPSGESLHKCTGWCPVLKLVFSSLHC
eukprot:11491091-Prorocentrum_lima.AAC.1